VTGASGHIGSNLIRAMVAQGRKVRALQHVNQRNIQGLGAEIVAGDVCHPDSLRKAFKGADVVYHLAARISLESNDYPVLEPINVTGVKNVVEACIDCKVRRLVHFSSIHAFIQESIGKPIDETCPLVEPKNCPPYDRTKAAGEKIVYDAIERGLDAVIISPTAVIGPYDWEPSFLGEALLNLARGKMPALVAGGFDWVDVRDVVAGALAAEKKAPTGAKFLLSGHFASVCDLAVMVEEIMGTPAPKLVMPKWLAFVGAPFMAGFARMTGNRPLYTSASVRALSSGQDVSHDKAARELGYTPRPLRQTIVDTFEWFHESGYLQWPVKSK
jgi:nucleoside-diphosphate-sugar epimerase